MKAAPLRDVFHVVGTLLDGKYRVDQVVAEGGFGVVYSGHHARLDIPIAVKLLKPTRLLDDDKRDEQVASFLVEARTTAKLRHPNIAQVLDTGVLHTEAHPEGIPWTVFEWLDGETLDVSLKARRGSGGRSIHEVWKLMAPAIEAIAVAHEAGIVHRDLKPSNIMLVKVRGAEVSAHVLDFGIAKLIEDPEHQPSDDTTESAFVAFSPGYAAPEQLARSRTGFWTDVHALGLILSELLTDERPYGSDLAASVVNAKRPTPKQHAVDVGAWEPILERALALSTRARYPNARALYRALEAALTGQEIRDDKEMPRVVASVETETAPEDFTAPASETALDSQIVRKRSPIGPGIVLLGVAAVGIFAALFLRPKTPDPDPVPASAVGAAPPAPLALIPSGEAPKEPAPKPAPPAPAPVKKPVVLRTAATRPKPKPAASASSTSTRVGATNRFE